MVLSVIFIVQNGFQFGGFDPSTALGKAALGGLVFVPFMIGLYWMWNKHRIVDGANFDEVITIGPLIMMKFVVKTTKPHNVKTVVSMNPIMVDGTGMCGGCRLTVGGQTKFACVDGPDFDGFEVDFDEAMHRGTMYKPFEAHAREAECNLLKQEVQ